MNGETEMSTAYNGAQKSFSERLQAYCAKTAENPERMKFDQNFDCLRHMHVDLKVPIVILYDFMVNEESLKASLPTFRRWWYEKAPEDKKSRRVTKLTEQDQGVAMQAA